MRITIEAFRRTLTITGERDEVEDESTTGGAFGFSNDHATFEEPEERWDP